VRAAFSLVVLIAVTGGSARAHAAVDPAQTCRQRQLIAVSRLYLASYACWSRAFANLAFDPFACLATAEDRFRAAYASAATLAARSGSQCGLQMRADALLSIVASDVDPPVAAIAGNLDWTNVLDRKLRSRRIAAAGAFSNRALAAELEFTKRQDPSRRDARFALARKSLANAFVSADNIGMRRAIVYDGPGADQIAESLETAAGLWERLTRANAGSHAVSGNVLAAEATFVDSDVNDTNTSWVKNDSFLSAQPLPVPSTVGGYVNRPHKGPLGNSQWDGDPVDVYQASLRAGQVVVLLMGDDPATADLDLCLYGPSAPADPCSQGTGSMESRVAPADDTYFIEVYAFQGASTYTLSIGQTVPAAAAQSDRTDVEFVPGELIVKLRDAAPADAGVSALHQQTPVLPAELGLEHVAGDSSREMLVRLPVGAQRTAMFRALGVASDQQMLTTQGVSPLEVSRRETILALKALHARPEVASVGLNTILRPTAVPSDPYYTYQWNYPLIHLPQAWDIAKGSPDVVVAVVDTGVRLDHPDLQGKLVAGYDFISDSTRARDGNGIDPDPNDPGDRGAGQATSSFHGTHVAGTIAAATDNGIGVAGVTWGSRVMPVRVLGVNGGTLYDVMEGVRYAAGLPNDSGTVPAKPADIINLSLGGGGNCQIAADTFTLARAAGVIVVAAAGNDGTSTPSFPASCDGVVSVAAVDLNRNPAAYSSFGPTIDVTAPGGDLSADRNGDGYADGVLSTLADDSVSPLAYVYSFYQGTSMATPHVSGVFALMRSVNPDLTPLQIDTLLSMGSLTEDLLTPGRDDRTGWGLIDARKAVIAAGAPDTGPAVPLSVTPSGLNFGLSLNSLLLTVANAGSDPIAVTSVAVEDPNSAPWLSLSTVSVDGNGLGSYRATVARGTLSDESYSATIDVVSSAGTVRVPVVMRVGGPTASDAGYHYILLVDAESLRPIDEVALPATNGAYAYAFENVPPGNYLIVAGSDLDNDGFICDGGEACGSYPTLDLPTPLSIVDQDVSNADFGTAFQQSIRTGAIPATSLPPLGLRRRAR
jgi:serine protease